MALIHILCRPKNIPVFALATDKGHMKIQKQGIWSIKEKLQQYWNHLQKIKIYNHQPFLKAQILRALLSNNNEMLHFRIKSIIQ